MMNRASTRYEYMLNELNVMDINDHAAIISDYERDLADTFTRVDHRRLIGAPKANRAEFLEHLRAWTHLGSGQPHYRITDVFDVVGERLVLCLLSIEFEHGVASEQNQVLLFDVSVNQVQFLASFDPDDVTGARAELHRLAKELELGRA
jgi:hypothetical protein